MSANHRRMYQLLLYLSFLFGFSLHVAPVRAVNPSDLVILSPASKPPGLRVPQSFNATLTPFRADQTRFRVPRTSLILNLVTFPGSPLDRDALGRAILNGQVQVRQHLATHQDSYLWPAEERELMDISLFQASSGSSALPPWVHLVTVFPAFAANNTNDEDATVLLDMENFDSEGRGDQRLRYSTIQNALEGLWLFLYQGRKEMETVFHIEDGALVVGFGKVYGMD